MLQSEIHVISNGNQTLKEFSSIVKQIYHHVTVVHIREKKRTESELMDWVSHLIRMGIPNEKLVMNGHFLIAGERGLGGVQLPRNGPSPKEVKSLFPQLTVGCSIHCLKEAVKKEREGADYVIFGNVFETSCKPGLRGQGLEGLKIIVNAISIPVIAIGGINPQNAVAVANIGADGIAVMSSVMGAKDPLQNVGEFNRTLEKVVK